MRKLAAALGAVAWLVAATAGEARGNRLRAASGDDGGGGIDVNLIVREVRVTPIRARVGDAVRVDVVIENRGEGLGTITARVYANGRTVASRLFRYDPVDGPSALYRESFVWDTTGARPGEYRIRAEVFDWGDSSPFDNDLEVRQPVTLIGAGEAFPSGSPGVGGEAVAVDPRWRFERSPRGSDSRNSPSAGGIVREKQDGRPQ